MTASSWVLVCVPPAVVVPTVGGASLIQDVRNQGESQ